MRRWASVLILAAALAACGQAEQSSSSSAPTEEAAAPPMMSEGGEMGRVADADDAPADAAQQAPSGAGQTGSTPTGPAPVLYLAYVHGRGIEVPSQRVAAVMDAHVRACEQAGVRLCQIVRAERIGDPDASVSGFVSLRGEPGWLTTFMGGIDADVDRAGGRVVSRNTSTEDLTRQIVDTEARLRAQTALRDRLQQLLRERPGRLADLLEVERELARVQAEIDAVQSSLAVMRTRVAMSELNISYASTPRPLGSDTMLPLRQAFADFLRIIVKGFAGIVYFIAWLIPIAIVVVPLAWLLLRWRRQRGGRFFRHGFAHRDAEEPRESPPPANPG